VECSETADAQYPDTHPYLHDRAPFVETVAVIRGVLFDVLLARRLTGSSLAS